eukprot:GGOE01000435.1.p1 GENE.GGOE01000435.1~~GGOE01000435.1.p1  ORF type:complete len:613 (+),score=232.50 GGOE01000435.1:208-1839(+)
MATFQPKVFPKSAADTATLTKVLGPHFLFKHLDDRELTQLVTYFQPRQYAAGDLICEEGESNENSLFHVIVEGMCMMEEDREIIAALKPFDTIGETEMMYNLPRKHSVFTQTPVRTFCIDRRTYQLSLHSTFAAKRTMYCDFLRNVNFLQGLSQPEMVQLADCLQPEKFQAGDFLLRLNDPPKCMYIIVEGTVQVVGRDHAGGSINVCEFSRGAIVGEMEFLHEHNNVADVVALSDEVRVARLDRSHFELCMGPLKDILKSSRSADPVYEYYNMKRAGSMERHKNEDGEATEEAINMVTKVAEEAREVAEPKEAVQEVAATVEEVTEVATKEEDAAKEVPTKEEAAKEEAIEVATKEKVVEVAAEAVEVMKPVEEEEVVPTTLATLEASNNEEMRSSYEAEIGELKYRVTATEQELTQCRRERQNLEVALQEANRSCLRIESESLLRIRQLEQELELRAQEVGRLRSELSTSQASAPSPGVSPVFSNGLSPGAPPLPPRPNWANSPSAAQWSPSIGCASPRPAHACLLPGCRLCHPQSSPRYS